MKEIKLEIITPSKKAFEGTIQSVTVPGSLGSFQILFNHAPILSSLEIGEMKVVDSENNTSHYAISGGTVEVLNNKVLVLAESFENTDEIDKERAEKAKERAHNRIKSREEGIDEVRAEAALKRAINRIKLVDKYS